MLKAIIMLVVGILFSGLMVYMFGLGSSLENTIFDDIPDDFEPKQR